MLRCFLDSTVDGEFILKGMQGPHDSILNVNRLAPNIYYLGAAGSVLVNGLRISGASGIYKSGDYRKGGLRLAEKGIKHVD